MMVQQLTLLIQTAYHFILLIHGGAWVAGNLDFNLYSQMINQV